MRLVPFAAVLFVSVAPALAGELVYRPISPGFGCMP